MGDPRAGTCDRRRSLHPARFPARGGGPRRRQDWIARGRRPNASPVKLWYLCYLLTFREAQMSRLATGDRPCWRFGAWGVSAALACVVAASWPAFAEPNPPIPNFAPDNVTGWLKGPGD